MRPFLLQRLGNMQALEKGQDCRGRVFVGADAAPLTFQVGLSPAEPAWLVHLSKQILK